MRFQKVIYFFQKRGFYVCERIAEKFGIRSRLVRTSFVYLAFITLGIGFAFYLFIAFWLKVKDAIKPKRTSVFDI